MSLKNALIGGPVVSRLSLADFRRIFGPGAGRMWLPSLSGCMKQRAEGVGSVCFTATRSGQKPEVRATLLGEACKARVVFAGEIGREHRSRRADWGTDDLAHLRLCPQSDACAGRVNRVGWTRLDDNLYAALTTMNNSNRSGSQGHSSRLVESCPVRDDLDHHAPERLGPAVAAARMLRRRRVFRNRGG